MGRVRNGLGPFDRGQAGARLGIARLGASYNEVCEVVRESGADLGISNLSKIPARWKNVDFTKPCIVSRVAMIIDIEALDKSGIDVIELNNLNRPNVKVSVGKGNGCEPVADERFPLAEKVYVANGAFEEISAPVLSGEEHVLVDDGLRLNLGMAAHPEPEGRLHLHVFEEYEDLFSIRLPFDQPEMRALIDGVLDEIENVGPTTLGFLVDKYMEK